MKQINYPAIEDIDTIDLETFKNIINNNNYWLPLIGFAYYNNKLVTKAP